MTIEVRDHYVVGGRQHLSFIDEPAFLLEAGASMTLRS